jgi:hypothetical protein
MYVIAYSITDVKLERDMNVYRVIATNFFAWDREERKNAIIRIWDKT